MVRVSPSHPHDAGRAGLGWRRWMAMCTVHAVVMLCVGYWQSLANRSMRIQDLYVGAVPIPQFIKKKSRG